MESPNKSKARLAGRFVDNLSEIDSHLQRNVNAGRHADGQRECYATAEAQSRSSRVQTLPSSTLTGNFTTGV